MIILKLLTRVLAVSAFVFITGCGTNCNSSCKEIALDCDCCPSVSISKLPAPSISNVIVFLETSGSMTGYMPDSGGTGFQKIIPNILWKLKPYNLSLYSIKESAERPSPINISDASENIVAGKFTWGMNTAIPAMLDTINNYQSDSNVTMLVSDMIFSPKNRHEVSQEVTQIADKVKTDKPSIVASLVVLTSDFHSKNKNAIVTSPYYILLRGKEENIEAIKDKIRQSAELFHQSYEEVNFGYVSKTPYYTLIPFYQKTKVGNAQPCTPSQKERYRINDIEGADSLSFWLGLDLKNFPSYSQNEAYLRKSLTVSPEGTKASVVDVISRPAIQNRLNDPIDKQLAQNCTHFVRVRAHDFYNGAALLKFQLQDSKPTWIDVYNHDTLSQADNNRHQTFGLNNIYIAIQEAFRDKSKQTLFDSVKISLSKKK